MFVAQHGRSWWQLARCSALLSRFSVPLLLPLLLLLGGELD